MNFTFKGLNLQ